jgi:hypothetical protein
MSAAPPTSAEQKAEALRRSLHDQHDAVAAIEVGAPAKRRDLLDQAAGADRAAELPYPVGRPFARPDHEIEAANRRAIEDDADPIDPATLF